MFGPSTIIQVKDWRQKWGVNYDEEQLEYLENLHLMLQQHSENLVTLDEDSLNILIVLHHNSHPIFVSNLLPVLS